MLIRKAKRKDSKTIAPLIFLAMEEIIYHFIGENSEEKAVQLLDSLIQESNNQYSYENCWVVEHEDKIAAAVLIYDGAKLKELRAPVAQQIKSMFNRNFSAEYETQAGEYYIDSIGVSPDQQGKGIGSKIFRFLIDEYSYRRNEPLGLLVDIENTDAQKLYLKLGFEIIGEKTLVGKRMNHLQFRAKDNINKT